MSLPTVVDIIQPLPSFTLSNWCILLHNLFTAYIIAFHYHSPLPPQDSPKTIGTLIWILSNIVKYCQISSNIVKYRFGNTPRFATPFERNDFFLTMLNNPSYGKSLFSLLWATSFTPNQDFGDFEWTPSRHFDALGRPLTRQIAMLVLLYKSSRPKSHTYPWHFPLNAKLLLTFHTQQ